MTILLAERYYDNQDSTDLKFLCSISGGREVAERLLLSVAEKLNLNCIFKDKLFVRVQAHGYNLVLVETPMFYPWDRSTMETLYLLLLNFFMPSEVEVPEVWREIS